MPRLPKNPQQVGAEQFLNARFAVATREQLVRQGLEATRRVQVAREPVALVGLLLRA